MPLHVWLPRAHPIAPAPGLGPDERRDDQGRALRARARAGRLARRRCRSGSACSCSRSARCPRVGGVVYALFQHDLKRLLALHSIENVGIIVLGLGACLLLRARGADTVGGVRARRRAAPHAEPRGLQGAALPRRGRVRARGRLARARPARRAAAPACRGPAARSSSAAMAIAGLPPLNGFASEWLTLQALLHVPAVRRRRRRARRRARARRARRDRGARGVLLRQGRRARAARRRRAATQVAAAVEAPRADARRRRRRSRPRASCSGSPRACSFGVARRPRAVARGRSARPSASTLPGTGSLPTRRRSRSRSRRSPAALALLRGRRAAAPAPTWACGQLVEPALGWTSAGLHEAAAARARGRSAPGARDRGAHARAASCRRSPTAATCRT